MSITRHGVRASLNPNPVEGVPSPNLAASKSAPSFIDMEDCGPEARAEFVQTAMKKAFSRTFYFQCDPPPSANRMWRHQRGRTMKSDEYDKWASNVWKEILAQSPQGTYLVQFTVPVAVSINLPRKHKARDLDNCIKPMLDAMQRAGLLKNDNLVHDIHAFWRPKSYVDQERVWIIVTELT